jgi:hypothetical protein
VNDDDLLKGLRDAVRRAEEEPAPPELGAPLGADFEAGVVAKLGGAKAAVRATPPRKRPAQVVALWTVLPALAVAAAVALSVGGTWRHGASPLPEYGAEVSGGVDAERGAGPATSRVSARADAPLRIVLRPATGTTEAPAVHAFVKGASGLREVALDTRTSASGSIELRGKAGDVTGGAPDATLLLVLTGAGSGLDAKTIAASAPPAPDGARVVPVDVHLVP